MTKNQILTNIAKKNCFVETLERRGCDDYDFHDIGVANLKAALEEAFEAGRKSKQVGRTNGTAVDFDPTGDCGWK